MILIFFTPEIILIISFLILAFSLGYNSFSLKINDRIIKYIFFTSIASCLIWLIFLFNLPNIIIPSYKNSSNKLFLIFKMYFVIAMLNYYFIHKYKNDFNIILITSTLLSCFTLISFNDKLIYFFSFSILYTSLIGYLFVSKINIKKMYPILPLIFLFIILLSFKLDPYIFLFSLMSIIITSYFIENKNIHYLLSSILTPFLIVYLFKSYTMLNQIFFNNLILIGNILIILSTILSFSKQFYNKISRNLLINYYGIIIILIGLNTNNSIIIALSLLILTPFLFDENLYSLLTISMIPVSPFFILKIILLVIVIKHSYICFFIIALSSPILTYNSFKKVKKINFDLKAKLLYLLSFFVVFTLSIYYDYISSFIIKVVN